MCSAGEDAEADFWFSFSLAKSIKLQQKHRKEERNKKRSEGGTTFQLRQQTWERLENPLPVLNGSSVVLTVEVLCGPGLVRSAGLVLAA